MLENNARLSHEDLHAAESASTEFRLARFALPATLLLVVYLLWGTGFATDDYVHLYNGLTRKLSQSLLPKEYLSVPLLHYTHAIAYHVLGDRPWAFDLLKALYAGAGVYAASRFFGCFVPPLRALLLGFLFVFLPLHDAAVYSLTNLYLVLSFCAFLLAYALVEKDKFAVAAIFAAAGSFTSYGSPPIAIGLAALALLRGKGTRAAAALLIPNIVYVAYYLTTSLVLKAGTQRLTGDAGLMPLLKNLVLQAVTFLDASVGPSAWAKIYYSIASLSLVASCVVMLASAAAIWALTRDSRSRTDPRLLMAAAVVLAGSLGMFALTGLYPQLAFSLGDRVMIYGSFFLVCCFAVLPLPRWLEAALASVAIFAIAGIATHWKDWRREVDKVAAGIAANTDLGKLPAGAQLYVSGHQYSRLGPYCHIDFFTADYVVQTFFKLRYGETQKLKLVSFNRRLVLENGALRDRKYGDVRPVDDAIWLYNSDRGRLERVAVADLPPRLAALPDEVRHWTQTLTDGPLRTMLLKAVPRLQYAY